MYHFACKAFRTSMKAFRKMARRTRCHQVPEDIINIGCCDWTERTHRSVSGEASTNRQADVSRTANTAGYSSSRGGEADRRSTPNDI